MNILFFLTPKNDVAYIQNTYNLKEVLEKMERYQYSSIPIINKQGKYVGTLTEGDVLWGIKNGFDLNLKRAEDIPIGAIKRKNDYVPIRVDSNMENLLEKAMKQNYVPVVDDQNNFIGIITRRDIMQYFCSSHKTDKVK